MSSPDINYPAQPSYGEGMAEALKAQAEFLKGTGDFADVGSLESLLPLEESIRKKTAQTDTDIFRQTLLGGETQTKVVRTPDGRFGIPDGEVVMSSEGANAGRYQVVRMPETGRETDTAGRFQSNQPDTGQMGGFKIFDTETGGLVDQESIFKSVGYIDDAGNVTQ